MGRRRNQKQYKRANIIHLVHAVQWLSKHCMASKYKYEDSKVLAPVVCFAKLV